MKKLFILLVIFITTLSLNAQGKTHRYASTKATIYEKYKSEKEWRKVAEHENTDIDIFLAEGYIGISSKTATTIRLVAESKKDVNGITTGQTKQFYTGMRWDAYDMTKKVSCVVDIIHYVTTDDLVLGVIYNQEPLIAIKYLITKEY